MKIIKPISLTVPNVKQVTLQAGEFLFPLLTSCLTRAWIDVPDFLFENAENLSLEIEYEDGSQKTFSKPNKNQWIWLKGECNHKYTPFRQNSYTGYNNNKTDKDSIQELLAAKYNEAAAADSTPKGQKA